MSNRGSDYSRMKKGETKKLLALVQSLRDTKGRGRKLGKMAGKSAPVVQARAK